MSAPRVPRSPFRRFVAAMFSFVFLVIWVLCATLGYMVGRNKGRAVEGAILGLLLGLIGVLIVALLRPAPSRSLRSGPGGWDGRGERWGARRWAGRVGHATGPRGDQWGAGAWGGQGGQDGQDGGRYEALPPASIPAGWFPDPSGRFEYRWWDGKGWSEHVSTNGVASLDATTPSAPW